MVGLDGFVGSARSIRTRASNFGLRYQCPMCGAHLKSFLPDGEGHAVLTEKSVIGGGYRPNVHCPVCYSTDRERLVYTFLKNRPNVLSPGMKLLHVAPESGLGAWLRSKLGSGYVTADLMMEHVDVKVNLLDIQFPDASFDAVICNHVLEHIPDDAKAMAEIFRILKPGGWAILQVPISASIGTTYEDFSITDPAERERAFGQKDHVRLYARDYVERLRRAGFSVEPFNWTSDKKQYGGAENRFGLIEREAVFFASHP
jgi:SAM-dependent methyltransferase